MDNATEVKTKSGISNYSVKQKICAVLYIAQKQNKRFGITDKELVVALNKNRQQQINNPRNKLVDEGEIKVFKDNSQIQKSVYVGDMIEILAKNKGIKPLKMAQAILSNEIL